MGDPGAERRHVAGGDREDQVDRDVARLGAAGAQAFDSGQRHARHDDRLAGPPRHARDEEQDAVADGQSQAEEDQRDLLEHDPGDERAQRHPGDTAAEQPAHEGERTDGIGCGGHGQHSRR
ncbi:hypothetical protein ACIRSS_48255 [Amycolatopsis sp. NPDC101161]|uniref:hypothetical protein n=1 Tax=Amycolatopsis sp. NPDC101161 TaxID=3363940 RepID=UPI003826DF47